MHPPLPKTFDEMLSFSRRYGEPTVLETSLRILPTEPRALTTTLLMWWDAFGSQAAAEGRRAFLAALDGLGPWVEDEREAVEAAKRQAG